MPRVLVVGLSLLLAPAFALADDQVLSIAGSVGVFRTDTRILNPSFDKEIEVQAFFLPVGNTANVLFPPVVLRIGKRQMREFDDAVQSIFNITNQLGAIYLSSADRFIANSRIYAQTPSGTLGQFVPGLPIGLLRTKGALINLKSSAAFRTNIGAVNAQNHTAIVTWRLYDKNDALVATGTPITMPPYAVIGPTSITSGFFFNAGTADLSDAWVSYSSDSPIFAYASVIDSVTTDPTFITAEEDTGVEPPQPSTKTFNITARSFEFDVAEGPIVVQQGDRVVLRVTGRDTTHGFGLEHYAPAGITSLAVGQTKEIEFVADRPGSFIYFCLVSTCGTGHFDMEGTMVVNPR